MSSIEAVKKMMGFSENTHMCDISEITEDHIHLESWNEEVPKSEFDEIAEVIANDGYDISGFELIEIPHPECFCFGNSKTNEYFDVVKFWDNKWQFSYIKDSSNALATSIAEAIQKNEWGKDD